MEFFEQSPSIKFPANYFFLKNFTKIKITKHRKNDYMIIMFVKQRESKNEGGYTKCRKRERKKERKKE